MRNDVPSRPSFLRTVAAMAAAGLKASPAAFAVYLAATAVFTGFLVMDLHMVRSLIDALPLFADGKLSFGSALAAVLLLGSVNVAFMLANAAMNFAYERLERKSLGLMTGLMAEKASRLELVRFESAGLYDGIERASKGMRRGIACFDQVACSLIFHGGYFAALSVYLSFAEPLLALGVAASFLPVALSRYLRSRARARTEEAAARLRREAAHYEACLVEPAFLKETRSAGASAFFLGRYADAVARLNRETFRSEARSGTIELGLKALGLLGYAGLLALSLWLVVRGRITPGLFGAVYFAMASVFKWFDELFDRLGDAYENAALAGSYVSFLGLPERGGRRAAAALPGGIRLEGVSFSYPGRDSPAIDGLDLDIGPGETLAVVGENGAGKSTLVRLVAGMLLPDTGRVSLGGVDTRELAPGLGRRGVSAVFQDYRRYAMSLRQNVGIGEPDMGADEARAAEALSRAGFDPDRPGLRKGMAAMLSREFDGADLSGGEWQRVAIARGLYRNYDLILLDEPTAAIDPLEESLVYRRFAEAAKGKTALVVTHRLGSARIASRIVVLDAGRLVESGSHEELMTLGGKYASMFASQARWYG